ncbi:MAG: Molybdenum cofactor cytidylyltransferase [Hyphomicrobiaceae bacterium hypho_1]
MAAKISAVILAGGRSIRMGSTNKLLAKWQDKTLLYHVAESALMSLVSEVIVVTGYEEERVRGSLSDLPLCFVSNPCFSKGLGTSLSAGISAVNTDASGAIVLLGDMPLITKNIIDQIIKSFAPTKKRSICLPSHNGQWGNPVLWADSFFYELKKLTGDRGARKIAIQNRNVLYKVLVETDSIFTDIDTPEDLRVLLTSE